MREKQIMVLKERILLKRILTPVIAIMLSLDIYMWLTPIYYNKHTFLINLILVVYSIYLVSCVFGKSKDIEKLRELEGEDAQ